MNLALTRFERRSAHAAFGTIFPGTERGTLPLGICDMDLDGYLQRTLSSIPFEPSIGLRLAIWVVALAPIFVLKRFATIASLSVEDREKVISAIYASPYYVIRSAAIALKAIGSLFYCGDARVRPSILGAPAPATTALAQGGPIVALRKRSNPEQEHTSQEQGHEQRRIA
jgi:hypothetical protein